MAQQRRRVKHTATFEERLAEEAIKFKEAAENQPPGSTARELLLRRARQAETASHINNCRPRHSKLCFPISGSKVVWIGFCEAFDGRISRLCDWARWATLSIGSISAALMRRRRGGSQKSPLMATPLSFGRPTAS